MSPGGQDNSPPVEGWRVAPGWLTIGRLDLGTPHVTSHINHPVPFGSTLPGEFIVETERMIHISYQTSGGVIEVAASGHACFAPAGQDVVCAAVSALLQTLALYAQGKKGGTAKAEKGVLRVVMQDGREPRAVAEAIIAGAWQIARQYPECVEME